MAKPDSRNETLYLTPSFWQDAWEAHRRCSLKSRRIKTDIECWNRLAGKIKRWTEEERTTERVLRVISWLRQQDVVLPGAKIMDIGAGAGSFSLPFANDGAKVVALEPVKELADELLEKAKRQGISEMPILTETWEDVSLTDERLKEQFDLVFASLTPGIHNAETLEKQNVVAI